MIRVGGHALVEVFRRERTHNADDFFETKSQCRRGSANIARLHRVARLQWGIRSHRPRLIQLAQFGKLVKLDAGCDQEFAEYYTIALLNMRGNYLTKSL